jgi:putative ABC transport system permease protein
MRFMLRLAFRNALRNKRRSLFTIASLMLGTTLFVAAKSFVDGIEKTLVSTTVDAEHSHLRVVTKAYLVDEDYKPLDIPFPEATAVAAGLGKEFPGSKILMRTLFSAQLGDGVRTLSARGLVVDPVAYADMFRVGTLSPPADPIAATRPYCWVGIDLADSFGWKVGDRIFIKAKTRTGSINAQDGVVIAGLIASGSTLTDNFSVLVPKQWANAFLNIDETFATEVFARFQDSDDAERAEAFVAASWATLDAETWRENTQFIRDINDLRRKNFYLVVGIILIIGALSVANTCLMAGFERTKEVGTLLALGYPKGSVRTLFILETLIIGVVGAFLGVLVGALASYHFSIHPIELSHMNDAEGGMPMPSLLYFELSPLAVVVGFIIGLVVALVASVYPAFRASRLDPLVALREE